MKKKLLLMMLLLCAVVQGAWAQSNWDVWDGSSQSVPWSEPQKVERRPNIHIASGSQLAWIAERWNNRDVFDRNRWPYQYDIILEADIDMTAGTWTTLGGHEYEGHFYGNGHTIKIKNTSKGSSNYQAFFAQLGSDAVVEDLHVQVEFDLGNGRMVGGITGVNYGRIENCWVTGSITTNHYSIYHADLGSIAGYNGSGAKVSFCCSDVQVKNTAKNTGVGGLVGRNYGKVEHSIFYGSVTSDRAQDNIFVGIQRNELKNCFQSFDAGVYDLAGNREMFRAAAKYPTLGKEFIISTEDDWNTFTSYVNHGCSFKDKNVKLTGNINAKTMAGISAMSSFQGTFDGGGHTMTLNMGGLKWMQVAAPFRYINCATIKNLTVAGSITTEKVDYASALVGCTYGPELDDSNLGMENYIENCVVKAEIGGKKAAGFVGNSLKGRLRFIGCVFDGKLTYDSEQKNVFIAWGEYGSTQMVANCLYIVHDKQHTENLALVRAGNCGNSVLDNTYSTRQVSEEGKLAFVYASDPGTMGDIKSWFTFDNLKVYNNGIWYNNRYYTTCTKLFADGDGSEENPYQISSSLEWDNLASSVDQGNQYVGKFFKLTQDIEHVGTTVGVSLTHSFRGTFDGGGHTMTVNYTGGGAYLAPFSIAFHATIKNLHVAGTINAAGNSAAGIVGASHGTVNLADCRSSVTISSSVKGTAQHGGLVGHSDQWSRLNIDRCVFDGRFETTAGSTSCGGFIGYKGAYDYSINNSVMKPASVAPGMLSGTFVGSLLSSRRDTYPIANSFFVETDNLPANQGIQAYKAKPEGEISRQQTVDGGSYWVACTVKADQLYQYKEGGITIKAPTVTDVNGTQLTAGTDFTYTPTTVSDQGTRNLTVTGNGSTYSGTKTIPFFVTGDTKSESLTTGEYTIHDNLEIDWRIIVSGNVVINIPSGVTLAAKKGFELPEGNSLTINGSGVMVINECETGKTGIGGATMGSLTINGGQVTILGGEGAAGIGADAGKTASGAVTLGWTETEDFIQCSSYAVSTITFADGKEFVYDGTSEKATAETINTHNKIVAYVESGTEKNPFIINNVDDWNTFVAAVADGKDYSGKFVKLTTDIEVSTKAGVWSETESERRAFCGTFDGDGHTITATITDADHQGTALFGFIKNADIKNLNVKGIVTGSMYAAALVGFAGGQASETGNVLMNCKVSAIVDGGTHIGGLLGNALDSKVSVKDCVFSGTMMGGDAAKGVFIGWGNNAGDRALDNCFYLMPESQNTTGLDLARADGTVSVSTSCYKTTDAGSLGTQVYTAAADGEINKKVAAADGNSYYIPCTISGVKDYYIYTGSTITIAVPTVTAADGTTLTKDTDFTSTTNPASVLDEGSYTLTVSGTGSYTGEKNFVFAVYKDIPVTSSTTEMTSGTYKAYNSVTVDNRINIKGDVTLVLTEGAALRATKGIELSSGNMLTIKGPGILIIDDCAQGKSGIGAESMGTLSIRGGQLDIQGAAGAAGIGSDAGKIASGELTIRSSAVSDYVKCSSYAVRSNSFSLSGGFVIEGEQTIATTKNIGGKKIIPAMVLDDQNGTNDAELQTYDGKKLAVALNGRTIYLDGKWNTICLPFDFNINSFKGVEARTLKDASIVGTTLNLTFDNPVDELKAGVPYIIKFNAETYVANGNQNLVNPVFEGVTIDKTDRSYDNGAAGGLRVRFIGTYNSLTFDADDKSILFMGGESKLRYPATGASIGACRAYFKIGEDGAASNARIASFNLNFGDGETTGIDHVQGSMSNVQSDNWYTLDGRKLNGKPTQPGVYINGGKKVVIK